MTEADAPEPTFTASTVQRVLRIPSGTMGTWSGRNVFDKFDSAATVRGRPRMFTLDDVFRLALIRGLTLDCGLPLPNAQLFAEKALEWIDASASHSVTYGYYTPTVAIWFTGQEPIDPESPYLLTVNIDRILSEVTRRLKADTEVVRGLKTDSVLSANA